MFSQQLDPKRGRFYSPAKAPAEEEKAPAVPLRQRVLQERVQQQQEQVTVTFHGGGLNQFPSHGEKVCTGSIHHGLPTVEICLLSGHRPASVSLLAVARVRPHVDDVQDLQ